MVMRGCVYDAASPSGVKMVEALPMPRSRRGSVLVRVRACGVNPVDAKFVIGDKLPESWMAWASRRVTGHTPGFDFSGEVFEARAPYATGDEVFGFSFDPSKIFVRKMRGSFAEYVSAPLDQVARKPKSLSHAEAAALPLVGTTALQALTQHGVKRGDRVLIVGASGGVGHVAVQITRHLGADCVAVCSSRNAEFAAQCGATTVCTYDGDRDVVDQIKDDASKRGAFDFVLDCVSSADKRDVAASYATKLLKQTPPVVKRRAENPACDAHNYCVLGGATADWGRALLKRLLSINTFPRGFELFWIKMPGSHAVLTRIAEFTEKKAPEGNTTIEGADNNNNNNNNNNPPSSPGGDDVINPLKPKVQTTLPFNEASARAAFDQLRSRRTSGKIVMEMMSTTPPT